MFRISFLILVFLSTTLIGQQIIVKIPDHQNRFKELNSIGSIDYVKDKEARLYLWGNDKLDSLIAKGFEFEILPHPVQGKSIVMATTIDQMANWDRYPTYTVYLQMMQKFAQDYPTLCRLDTIGYSVNGRILLAVEISDNVGQHEDEPQVFYTSTMHGDETTGFVLLLRLIDYLLKNYGTDPKVTYMVNNMRIFINPNANPDGTYYGGNNTVANAIRNNAHGVDLNRNFPDPRTYNNYTREPETQAMMNYAGRYNFVLSANFHGGAEIMNYPWDTWTTNENPHADAQWFYDLCKRYVDTARKVKPNYMTDVNPSGITEGGDWYVVEGGRQDYMNYWHNCKEVTVELSSTKLLGVEYLNNYWNYNKNSLLNFLLESLYGLRGIVTGENNQPLAASVEIINYDKYNSHVKTNPIVGNYHRMLNPGTYYVKFSSPGYLDKVHKVTIPAWNSSVRLDVQLTKTTSTQIKGYVFDLTTGQRLSGVEVALKSLNYPSAVTDVNGNFTINYIEGDYIVEFRKANYEIVQIPLSLPYTDSLIVGILPVKIYSFESDLPSEFTMSGNLPWQRDNSQAYHRSYSLRSGAIGNNQSSSVTLTKQTRQGNFIFYKKVSSEAGYDKLSFYIDGVLKASWSGEVAWSEYIINITEGQHTFKWTYSKDASTIAGADACWIDYIILPDYIPRYNVTFNVTLNGIPYSGATVFLEGYNTITTNNNGSAVFSAYQMTSGQLKYRVCINENLSDSGYVFINNNLNIQVNFSTTNLTPQRPSNVVIYPNPVTDFLTINTPNLTKISIYDLHGQKLIDYTTSKQTEKLNLSSLKAGIYMLTIETDNKKHTYKLVKQ